jgi:uncharacterized membrane protein HdeD (DUF308 family)
MFTFLSRYWWALVARGFLAVLLAAFAFAWPMHGVTGLFLAFGAVALADGLFAIGLAIAGRRLTPGWWIPLVQGLLGVGAGVLVLVNPGAGTVLISIAAWAIGLGLLQIVTGVMLGRDVPGGWWLGFGGLLAIAFGILCLRFPADGTLAVLWPIGSCALVWGATLMLGGLDVHQLSRHGAV